ncbi:SgcJ/EcaC family oxidoreductase [Nocardia sp. R7R-8]|uniref:SgcJ/EcaC family oxidoreductase n=1 Tax=Nocardia sp. R7R-8 TaxID=3459304 RepID=UPI00403E25A3
MSTTAAGTTAELEAIRAVVASVQHAQQNELVDEFVALFRADAIWTTGHGKRLFGRAAIAEFTAQVLPGATAHGTATYEVEHVLFIRPDVAAVKVRQRRGRPGQRRQPDVRDVQGGRPLVAHREPEHSRRGGLTARTAVPDAAAIAAAFTLDR